MKILMVKLLMRMMLMENHFEAELVLLLNPE